MAVSFKKLRIGAAYTRAELAELWGFKGSAALSRGIVTPAGTPYIVLFITREKQRSLPQYEDTLAGDVLEIEGEMGHTADRRLVEAERRGDEIHLFYRERHHKPFTYVGEVHLTHYRLYSERPSRFRFTVKERSMSKRRPAVGAKDGEADPGAFAREETIMPGDTDSGPARGDRGVERD